MKNEESLPPVILSEAKDLSNSAANTVAVNRSFASLRMTILNEK